MPPRWSIWRSIFSEPKIRAVETPNAALANSAICLIMVPPFIGFLLSIGSVDQLDVGDARREGEQCFVAQRAFDDELAVRGDRAVLQLDEQLAQLLEALGPALGLLLLGARF